MAARIGLDRSSPTLRLSINSVAAARRQAASDQKAVANEALVVIAASLGDDGTALGNKVKQIEQRLNDLEALP